MQVNKRQCNRSQVRLWTGARSKDKPQVNSIGVLRVGWNGTRSQRWEEDWQYEGGRNQVQRSEGRGAVRGEGEPKVEARDGWLHRSGRKWTRGVWRKWLGAEGKQTWTGGQGAGGARTGVQLGGRRRAPGRFSRVVRGTESFQGRPKSRKEQTVVEVVQGRCLGAVTTIRSKVRSSLAVCCGVGVAIGVFSTRAETEVVGA